MGACNSCTCDDDDKEHLLSYDIESRRKSIEYLEPKSNERSIIESSDTHSQTDDNVQLPIRNEMKEYSIVCTVKIICSYCWDKAQRVESLLKCICIAFAYIDSVTSSM